MLPVIQVENLSKAYQIGEFSTGTIAHDIRRWYIRSRGKEDPYLRIGEVNDRTVKGESDIVWSLRDINFDIEQGDAVGIIGRNGAGKSTLLKILSRVTTPTTGSIKVKGRIASLLEVGTGFHPELTGRENIFLNGAILGMRKQEIKDKFDEIVEFSGVQRYIDTPVKRYSSGMYVRLAFAVAAHLESEILIVDEVLAVGDAEFQKKCLGKMGDVRLKEGRTVIFVSHNMEAINRLCNTAIYLEYGAIKLMGNVDDISKQYMHTDLGVTAVNSWPDLTTAPGNDKIKLLSAFVHDEFFKPKEILQVTEPIGIQFTFEVFGMLPKFTHGITLYNESEVCIFSSHDLNSDHIHSNREVGKYSATVWIPANILSEGSYTVHLAAFENYGSVVIHFNEPNSLKFTVIDYIRGDSARGAYAGPFPGVIRPLLRWESSKI